jgi:hypothetical protein
MELWKGFSWIGKGDNVYENYGSTKSRTFLDKFNTYQLFKEDYVP